MHTPKMIDISSVINSLSMSLGFEQKMVESSIQQRWEEIMGEKIANHTIPGQIRYKKLYIHVDNPVWMHQLLFLKDEILNRVNCTIGREIINEVRFKLGTGPDNHTADYTKQDSTQMTSAALNVIPT